MTPDLSTSLARGSISLPCCVYNASGPRSGTASALHKVFISKSGAVLTKSATLLAQTGNPQPRTWQAPDGQASLNSEGLPNNGIDYYISKETIQECCGEHASVDSKPYMVSLSGKTLADNLEMLRRISSSPTKSRIAAVELNLACPNVIGKPIIGYDFDQMNDILTQISKSEMIRQKQLPPLGVKLPPYFDFQHFAQAAAVINQFKDLVKFVVSINTLGNALAIDPIAEAPVISSNSGFAGLSGPAVKYTALANVRKLRSLLVPEIDVVGVGGILSGRDVFEMLLAGASAVQVATCHWKEGPICFDRIHGELSEILSQRGYKSVKDVIGKLKDWTKEGAALSREKSKQEGALSTKEIQSTGNSDAQFYKTLCGVLALLLAVLCADKWTHIKLLPQE